MPRSAASIQSEIDRIETLLSGDDALISKAGANGVNAERVDYDALTKRLDKLYLQLGRADGSAPMFIRGRIKGLGGRDGYTT